MPIPFRLPVGVAEARLGGNCGGAQDAREAKRPSWAPGGAPGSVDRTASPGRAPSCGKKVAVAVTAKKKILIIEDEPHIVLGLTTPSSSRASASSRPPQGKAGVELAHSQKPNAVLLDLMLPDMNGFSVCEEHSPRQSRTCPSSCSRPVSRRSTRSAVSTPARTTT